MKLLFMGGAFATLSLLLSSTTLRAQNLRSKFPEQSDSVQASKVIISQNSEKISTIGKNQPSQVSEIAKLLPSETALYASVKTKADYRVALSRYQLFDTIQKNLTSLLPENLNFDYSRDIESWLGEQVAFAILPKVGSDKFSLNSNLITIASIKDETRFQQLLDTFIKDKENIEKREYKGVTIVELKTPPETSTLLESKLEDTPKELQELLKPFKRSPKNNLTKQSSPVEENSDLAYTTIPGYIILGNSSKAIEKFVDSREKTGNLAENSQFQETIQNLQNQNTLAVMYQNPATYFPVMEDLIKDPDLPFASFGLNFFIPEQLQQITSINSSVILQPEGLRFQVSTSRNQTSSKNLSKVSPKETAKILQRMPAATYSTFTGTNINQYWQNLVKVFNTQPELKDVLTNVRQIVTSSTSLDLDNDIIGWMDGEFSLFLYPTKGGFFNSIFPNANVGYGIAIETSNRNAAETTLKKLENFLTSFSNGEIAVKNRSHKGQSITSWEASTNSSQSLFAYSWVDNNTLIFTTGFGAITDLVPKPNVALTETYNFTTAINTLPHPNNGYFYINMGSLLSWVYGFVPGEFKEDKNFKIFQDAIGSVYSISATTSTTPNREQFDALIVLAPKR